MKFLTILTYYKYGYLKLGGWLVLLLLFLLAPENEDYQDLKLVLNRTYGTEGSIVQSEQLYSGEDYYYYDEDGVEHYDDPGILRYKYWYNYEVDDVFYENIAYSDISLRVGDQVQVRYLPKNPDVAVIQGHRNSRDGLWDLVKWSFFLLAGSIILLVHLVKCVRFRNLLAVHATAAATRIGSDKYKTTEDQFFSLKTQVYRFSAGDKVFTTSTRPLLQGKYEDTETVLYRMNKPSANVLLKAIPNRIKQHYDLVLFDHRKFIEDQLQHLPVPYEEEQS